MASLSIVTLLLSALCARATSVVPPSFQELVGEADLIARGSVTDVSSRWVERPQGRVIQTFVTFAVEKQFKGSPTTTVTLEFLGGSVGGETMRVAGMPEFTPGQAEILFVRGNGRQFCPLVRFGHGRYHVRSDSADHGPSIARNDNSPLGSVAEVQLPADDHGDKAGHSAGRGMSRDDFEAEVGNEVARQNR